MKMTGKIWLFVIFVVFACISLFVSLNPIGLTFLQKGVVVSSIDVNSSLYDAGMRKNMIITEINGNAVNDMADFMELALPYSTLLENETIRTDLKISGANANVIGLFGNEFLSEMNVKEISISKLKTGLDLQGGARAFVRIVGEGITSADLDDSIAVLEERLNTYGLTDMRTYKVETADEPLIGIEIAGSSPDELESLIEEQGHFEAKIGNETVFVGGNDDITHVSRTGEEAVIYDCGTSGDTSYCNFRFSISLSLAAADRFANITKNLDVLDDYLSENITFYIDDVETSALKIASSLRGVPETTISITGSEIGDTQQDAYDNTKAEMNKLQTILITGSLPYDLEIVKIDRISANLGSDFSKRILFAGLIAFVGVVIFTFFKYRNMKICLALFFTNLSEILITLGIASLINWNLDLASIAGIIAAIGTGIDSEIVILDETTAKTVNEGIKQKIKKALFIIMTSFATTFVALLPLTGLLGFLGIGSASAGLLKGFAVTTIIGLCIGVFVSRPAFMDIARQLKKEE